jgi:hypothetical protein
VADQLHVQVVEFGDETRIDRDVARHQHAGLFVRHGQVRRLRRSPALSAGDIREQRGRVAIHQMQDRAGHHFVAAHGKRDAVLAVGATQLQRIVRAEIGERERLTAAARHQRARFGGGRRSDPKAFTDDAASAGVGVANCAWAMVFGS